MSKPINWNEEPYYPNACPEMNAIEFDLQYDQNRAAGEAAEQSGQDRPEPNGRGYNAG